MEKSFQLIFKDDEIKLHTKVKSMVPHLNESMNEFIIKAIRERIEKLEKQKSGTE